MKKFVEKVKSIFTKVKNFVKKHWKKAAAAVGVAVICSIKCEHSYNKGINDGIVECEEYIYLKENDAKKPEDWEYFTPYGWLRYWNVYSSDDDPCESEEAHIEHFREMCPWFNG